MLDLNPSPVRVSSEAARKLPRTVLLTLLTIFILVGLFSRDLWSSQESRMLAEVLAMIRWLLDAEAPALATLCGRALRVFAKNAPLTKLKVLA